MDVALIRGPHLRPNGVIPWDRLDEMSDDINITAFKSSPARFGTDSLQMEVRSLDWWDGKLDIPGHDHVVWKGLGHLGLPRSALSGMRSVVDDFDVVHTSENYNLFSLQAAYFSAQTDTEFVFTAGENIPYFPGHCITKQVKRYVNRSARAATTTTMLGKRALIHEGFSASDIEVIQNTIDFDKFERERVDSGDVEEYPDTNDSFDILFVHGLTRQKGVRYLIDAFESLDIEDTRLILVGRNNLSDDYYSDAVEANDRVVHIEYIPNDRISDLYNLADVFVLPSITVESNQEQFGVAVLEAMACGTPSVVTDVGGLPFVVERDHTSLVVEERSTEALRAAIERLFRDSHLRTRLGENSYQYVREEYDTDCIATRLQQFYGNL